MKNCTVIYYATLLRVMWRRRVDIIRLGIAGTMLQGANRIYPKLMDEYDRNVINDYWRRVRDAQYTEI